MSVSGCWIGGEFCYWDGTAPYCQGRCPAGFREDGRSSTGQGSSCWTGSKARCCIAPAGQYSRHKSEHNYLIKS